MQTATGSISAVTCSTWSRRDESFEKKTDVG